LTCQRNGNRSHVDFNGKRNTKVNIMNEETTKAQNCGSRSDQTNGKLYPPRGT